MGSLRASSDPSSCSTSNTMQTVVMLGIRTSECFGWNWRVGDEKLYTVFPVEVMGLVLDGLLLKVQGTSRGP